MQGLSGRRGWLRLTGVVAGLHLLTGCGANHARMEPQREPLRDLPAAQGDARAEAVRHDPVGYLYRVAEKCRELNQYTLTFTRYERRGLLQRLYGPERIACWFRRRPFSVRMKWLDEDIKHGESVYVEGQANNRVRFVTRWWCPPLLPPPAVNHVDLQTPVIWGESKRPLTDFGLERLMEQTLASFERAGKDVVLRYEGLTRLPDGGPVVHHIHLEYPQTQHKVCVQELYIDILSDLPAGTVLKYPSGKIDAAYFYTDINTDVSLTDDDFLLPAEHTDQDNSSSADPSQ